MTGATTAIELLLLVVAVGALVYFGLVARGRASLDSSALQLVGRLTLEPRRAIYLVKVADTVLVVGASEHGLVKLGEVDADKVPPPPPLPPRPTIRDLFGGRR